MTFCLFVRLFVCLSPVTAAAGGRGLSRRPCGLHWLIRKYIL